MRAAIAAEFKAAIPTYDERPRSKWIFDYSCQNTIVVSRLYFTAAVDEAFNDMEEGNENALKVGGVVNVICWPCMLMQTSDQGHVSNQKMGCSSHSILHCTANGTAGGKMHATRSHSLLMLHHKTADFSRNVCSCSREPDCCTTCPYKCTSMS